MFSVVGKYYFVNGVTFIFSHRREHPLLVLRSRKDTDILPVLRRRGSLYRLEVKSLIPVINYVLTYFRLRWKREGNGKVTENTWSQRSTRKTFPASFLSS